MAFINLHYFSNILNKMTEVNVIIPEKREIDGSVNYSALHATPLKTVWLLHGLSGDATDWYRMTGLERYATSAGYAVIMPDVDRSFYNNMSAGRNYWDFITQELPTRIQMLFPLSKKRQDNVIIGNSMGGYGALKWGLNHPEKFSRIAALSGVIDLNDFYQQRDIFVMPDFDLVFKGQDLTTAPLSLIDSLKKYNPAKFPLKVYTACGEEDPLYNQNLQFSQLLSQKLANNYQWISQPGIHDWNFWDQQLAEVFEWLSQD